MNVYWPQELPLAEKWAVCMIAVIRVIPPDISVSKYWFSLANLVAHSEKSYLATVGIDFGTTYSGFAFSFNKEQGDDAIFMNRDWENELGHRTSKTPTCLLLKPDRSFDSFGYKALEKYTNLRSVFEEKDFFFFQHFKMELHNEEVRWVMPLVRRTFII